MDNRNGTANNANKLLKILSEEIILNKINVAIFNNRNINHMYEKFFKYMLIFLVYFKFMLVEFPYDNTVKSSMKKVISGLVTSFLIIYENYILTPQISKMLMKHGDIHDKYYKASKVYNVSKGVRYQDVMVYALKTVESVSQQLKIFSK